MLRTISAQEITWKFKKKMGARLQKGESKNSNQITPYGIAFLSCRMTHFSFRLFVGVGVFFFICRIKRKHRNGFILFRFSICLKPDKNSNPSANKCKFNFYTLVSIKKIGEKSKLHDVCILVFSKQTNKVFFLF